MKKYQPKKIFGLKLAFMSDEFPAGQAPPLETTSGSTQADAPTDTRAGAESADKAAPVDAPAQPGTRQPSAAEKLLAELDAAQAERE